MPLNSGVLSALGMLAAQPGRELVRTRQGLMHAIDEPSLAAELQLLLQEAQSDADARCNLYEQVAGVQRTVTEDGKPGTDNDNPASAPPAPSPEKEQS